MESENSIHIARPKILRRLNLETCPKFTQHGDSTMSPMTNLAHNLSGTSLDSTPKRKTLSNGEKDVHTPYCLAVLIVALSSNNGLPVSCGMWEALCRHPHLPELHRPRRTDIG